MFFSTELLARRDSGFGLLWLAATLGSKSSFKKLPKRSVMTADISQLCDLIAEPEEPLALRLSSNLMVGVVRVYRVKQEIFLSDVTTCFHSLKKAVQEFQSMTLSAAQLQMAQPTVRPDTVTLQADPGAEFAVNFDHFFADWDEFLEKSDNDVGQDDDDYSKTGGKSKSKKKQKSMSVAEDPRVIPHTLNENLEQLLSTSFDASFTGNAILGVDPSSSQMDDGFGFVADDNPFGGPDDMGLDGIGEELAKELGEGWGFLTQSQAGEPQLNADVDMHFNNAMGDINLVDMDAPEPGVDITVPQNEGLDGAINEEIAPLDLDLDVAPTSPHAPDMTPRLADSPEPLPKQRPDDKEGGDANVDFEDPAAAPKKPKRTRLLVDARTELTDEELQASRTNYMQGQNLLRDELVLKKLEKDGVKIIEEMICGVPRAFTAQVLMDFWSLTLKVQMDARVGIQDWVDGEPPRKRRKISKAGLNNPEQRQDDMPGFMPIEGDDDNRFMQDFGNRMDVDDNMGLIQEFDQDINGGFEADRIRSSEEPDVARRASRPPSGLGSFLDQGRADILPGSSQRSSLFPWDNAGPSSSAAGAPFGSAGLGSDRMSIGQADIRLRRSRSGSRRASSLVPNRVGSVLGDVGMSPLLGDALQGKDDDFIFDLPGEDKAPMDESQISELNLVTLERNSHNFLEYAKMQMQTLPHGANALTFDDVVPRDTSTPHVAAAAFYHCLVLATKDHLRLDQETPYGPVKLRIK